MAKDATQVKMGVCDVTFNSVDLGHTSGGCEVEYKPKYKEITVDQYGETPVDKILVGEELTVKAKLAESTFAVLKTAIQAATLLTQTTDNKLKIGQDAGFSLASVAAELTLHPVAMGEETEGDVVIYKAVVSEGVKLGYEVDKERVYEVTFVALVDESKDAGNRLGHIGTDITEA